MIEFCNNMSFGFLYAVVGKSKGMPLNIVGVVVMPMILGTEVLW